MDKKVIKKLLSSSTFDPLLFNLADKIKRKVWGKSVYIRGLIEYSSYCKNSCFYCGLRRQNINAKRRRLKEKEIYRSVSGGYKRGIRTFVLQGGEDCTFLDYPPSKTYRKKSKAANVKEAKDKTLHRVIKKLYTKYSDISITLSSGVLEKKEYKRLKKLGCHRYLLKMEEANKALFSTYQLDKSKYKARKQAIRVLKRLHFVLGTGFIVGLPGERVQNIIENLSYLKRIKPNMIALGPFIATKNTPLEEEKDGSALLCIKLIALCRLIFPYAFIPATTALSEFLIGVKDGCLVEKKIREEKDKEAEGGKWINARTLALRAGANVLMQNLTSAKMKDSYKIYDRTSSTNKFTLPKNCKLSNKL